MAEDSAPEAVRFENINKVHEVHGSDIFSTVYAEIRFPPAPAPPPKLHKVTVRFQNRVYDPSPAARKQDHEIAEKWQRLAVLPHAPTPTPIARPRAPPTYPIRHDLPDGPTLIRDWISELNEIAANMAALMRQMREFDRANDQRSRAEEKARRNLFAAVEALYVNKTSTATVSITDNSTTPANNSSPVTEPAFKPLRGIKARSAEGQLAMRARLDAIRTTSSDPDPTIGDPFYGPIDSSLDNPVVKELNDIFSRSSLSTSFSANASNDASLHISDASPVTPSSRSAFVQNPIDNAVLTRRPGRGRGGSRSMIPRSVSTMHSARKSISKLEKAERLQRQQEEREWEEREQEEERGGSSCSSCESTM